MSKIGQSARDSIHLGLQIAKPTNVVQGHFDDQIPLSSKDYETAALESLS